MAVDRRIAVHRYKLTERSGTLRRMQPWPTWREAMGAALAGYARRPGGVAGDFRTSVHVGDQFATALLQLLTDVDAALDHPDPLDLVDLGAGGGELAAAVLRLAPRGLQERLQITCVELRERPTGLPAEIGWTRELPRSLHGLVVANEYLDDVPCEVVLGTDDGARLVMVGPDGSEALGPPPSGPDLAWLQRWWPVDPGDRAEVGRYRDLAWAGVIQALDSGVALAIDYAHTHQQRLVGTFSAGTLTGFRDGRRCPPVPDGLANVTAHVALDACADAGLAAGASHALLTTQREALRALWAAQPQNRLHKLAQRSELSDPRGMGGFTWLLQRKQCTLPDSL